MSAAAEAPCCNTIAPGGNTFVSTETSDVGSGSGSAFFFSLRLAKNPPLFDAAPELRFLYPCRSNVAITPLVSIKLTTLASSIRDNACVHTSASSSLSLGCGSSAPLSCTQSDLMSPIMPTYLHTAANPLASLSATPWVPITVPAHS